MGVNKIFAIGFGVFMIAGLVAGTGAFADSDERGERNERDERSNSDRRGTSNAAPQNALYNQECSSCHFPYLPGLLPERSWERVMNSTDKHFGENLALDAATVSEIKVFLKAYSSEKTNTEWGRKITQSAGSSTPERITDIEWIKKEHRKIKPEVFKRASIGSFSNCGACHQGGLKGDFEERSIRIPNN